MDKYARALAIIEKILYSLAIISFSIPIIYGIITLVVGIYVGYIVDKFDSEMGIINDTPSIIGSLLGSLILCFCNMPFWIFLTILFVAIGLIIHRKSMNQQSNKEKSNSPNQAQEPT
jgi:uncharacterized membrane protein